MRLSIVIPAYNEGHHLDAVVRRLYAAVREAEPETEIIIVDNGSADDTLRVAQSLATSLPNVRVEHIGTNIGYGNGILCGLRAAEGDVLGWAHADEQVNPEDIIRVEFDNDATVNYGAKPSNPKVGTMRYFMDACKVRALLRWKRSIGQYKGLKQTVEWHTNNAALYEHLWI